MMPCNNRLQIPEVSYSFCTAKFFLISTLHLPCWKLGNNISHLIHHRHTAHAIFFLSAFRHFSVCNSIVFSRLSSPSSLNSLQILFSRPLLIPVVFLWSLLQFVHLLLIGQHSTAPQPALRFLLRGLIRDKQHTCLAESSTACMPQCAHLPPNSVMLFGRLTVWPPPDLLLQHISHIILFLYLLVPVKIKNLSIFFVSSSSNCIILSPLFHTINVLQLPCSLL